MNTNNPTAADLFAIHLTAAEQAIEENGLRCRDDIGCHMDTWAQIHGEAGAEAIAEIVRDLLPPE